MSDIIQALLSAVVTREIDLAECDEAYAGVKLPVRVNWPRLWKKQRFALSKEHFAIRDALGAYTDEDSDTKQTDESAIAIDKLNKRADENSTAWNEWWSGILLMTPDEIVKLQEALSPPHWDWLGARIIARVTKYEVDETKKVNVSRGRTLEEPEPSRQTSGTDSSSQDG